MCHYILVWYYNCSLKLLPCCSYAAIFNSCRGYEQFIRKTWYLENNTDQSRDNFTKESTNKKNGGYNLQNWHPINKSNKSCQRFYLLENEGKICKLYLPTAHCSWAKNSGTDLLLSVYFYDLFYADLISESKKYAYYFVKDRKTIVWGCALFSCFTSVLPFL